MLTFYYRVVTDISVGINLAKRKWLGLPLSRHSLLVNRKRYGWHVKKLMLIQAEVPQSNVFLQQMTFYFAYFTDIKYSLLSVAMVTNKQPLKIIEMLSQCEILQMKNL